MTSETVEVARIALRLPPFWKSNVRLWIAQCDHAFTFSGISSDDTKYSALVANLMLKLSPTSRDEKPSHLLRKMKELSNGQLQDDFLQKFVASKNATTYPDCFVCILRAFDKLAIIADKVSEVVGASSTICAATTVPPPSQSSSCSVQPTMDSLARQIQELSLQVAELTRKRNSSRHQRYSSDRRRSHSRSRSVNRGSGICYYHRRYKEQARKCVSPCAFVQKRVSSVIAGMAEPSKHTSRLFLLDRKSGQKFLIDSGSEICVIPPSPTMNKSPQSNFSLFLLLIIPKFQPMPSILTVDANISFKNILSEYPDLSNPSLISKSASHGTVHHIITTGPPVTARPRRLHPKLYDAVKVEFEFLLAQGIIRPSKSPWSSPLHVVPKSNSTVRPVGDYRQLNSVTEFDSYPMPYLNDFAHALHGKKIFSKIDIFKAFHQIPIAECDIPKTAVTTPWGLYEYTHLCFGLVNAPQTFMRFMHEVLRGLPFCFVYLDDILCYSENAEEHCSHLRTIFQRLSSYGLKLNISKCVFGVTELIFLGHLITPDGIKPLPDKVQAVLDYKQPETRCKQALADAALLAHPSPSAPLALHVDASNYAIGGALHQVVDSELQPLAFFSRKLTSSEKSYSAYDRELLAIYSAIRHFRYMLEARDFTKCRTTGYHPQANGMIEELHRPLKSAIKCHATERWTEVLPIILLGLRASLKEDILCTPAELVFGTTIRLPGEMFDSSKPDDDVVNFVSKLKSHMQSLHPKPPKHHGKRPVFIHPGLLEATHVFLRRAMLRRPLQQPYDGPFKVLQRKDKVFFLDINGKRVSVSIDRCKPAFFLNTEDLQLPQTKNETPATVEPNATASTPATVESDPTASTPTQRSTRSGRKVHLPTRVFQFHISELLRGVGYILTTRNHIALWGRKCFPDAVDGIVRKFRAFVQGIFISHKNATMDTNAELADMHLAYGAANCSGPAAQRLYVERYPMRRIPSHNFFARLHQRLAETGSFERADMVRVRTVRTPGVEQNVLQHVERNPRTSTRSVANSVGVSHCSVWRILREQDMHPFHVQRVQTQQPEDYAPRVAFAQWYLGKCATNRLFPDEVFFSDEASFTREGIFNTHNDHI
ncbi:retrovirus-related Pol polyprotein from transposon 17.6 [Trichonephila clavipes]|nr:retrovirus-related Pol polyprotein from transposon 17.6 [Trichonephila clavipes]